MPITTKNLELYYINRPLADLAALKAKNVTGITSGESVEVISMSPYGGNFDWISTSAATTDDINVVLPTGHVGNGRWIRRGFDVQLTAAGKIVASQIDIANPFIYKGTIAVAADFPLAGTPVAGWSYKTTAPVTDNDPTRTNTGQAFPAGHNIVWNSTGSWDDLGASAVTTVFSRTGDVKATVGDYAATLVTNDSKVSGSYVSDALNNLNLFTDDTINIYPTLSRNVLVDVTKKIGINNVPNNATFYATYTQSINANFGYGSLVGTATGGATISAAQLDLAHDDLRYVNYSAVSNGDSRQTGAIKFKITPNYSGVPSTIKSLFSIGQATLSTNNLIILYHNPSSGILSLSILDSSGGTIISGANLGVWSPVTSTQYEFELNYDITAGATRLFIDGVQKGTTQTGTGTRSATINVISIGQALNVGTWTSNFKIDDFVIFNSVQHTANYSPSYSLSDIQVNIANGESSFNGFVSAAKGKYFVTQSFADPLDIVSKDYVDSGLSGKEPTITATTSADYYRGDKTFQPHNLNSNSDVAIVSPVVNNFLGYNGSVWNAQSVTSISGGGGFNYYLDDTTIKAITTENTIQVNTLTAIPVTTTEIIDTIVVSSATSPVAGEAYLYNTALGRTSIPAGPWHTDMWRSVDSATGVTSLLENIYSVIDDATHTLTVTGTGTTRTATVSVGGSPFLLADSNANITLSGRILTPKGSYQISGFTSSSVVTITVPAAYINESAVSYSLCRLLFTFNTGEINDLTLTAQSIPLTEGSFSLNLTDKLMSAFYATTTSAGARTVSYTHNGNARYTHFEAPLAVLHNQLPGLEGGDGTHYEHLGLTAYGYASVMNQSVASTASPTFAGLGLASGANAYSFSVDNPGSARTLSIQDPTAAANFLLAKGSTSKQALFDISGSTDSKKVTFISNHTDNRSITFQNSDGTVAFTSDIPSPGTNYWSQAGGYLSPQNGTDKAKVIGTDFGLATYTDSHLQAYGSTVTGAAGTGSAMSLGGHNGTTQQVWMQFRAWKESNVVGDNDSFAQILIQRNSGWIAPISFGGDGVSVQKLRVSTSANGFKISGTSYDAIFDASAITTSDKTFSFPNASGTVALTSDIPAPVTQYWSRNSGTSTLSPTTSNDNVDIGTGVFTGKQARLSGNAASGWRFVLTNPSAGTNATKTAFSVADDGSFEFSSLNDAETVGSPFFWNTRSGVSVTDVDIGPLLIAYSGIQAGSSGNDSLVQVKNSSDVVKFEVDTQNNITKMATLYRASDIETSITAHAGGGQGSATPLTHHISNVTTVATAFDSVILPASPTAGDTYIVFNWGTYTLAVFPASGGYIGNGAQNAEMNVGSSAVACNFKIFIAIDSTHWM